MRYVGSASSPQYRCQIVVLPSDCHIPVISVQSLREYVALSIRNDRNRLIFRLKNPNLRNELDNQRTLGSTEPRLELRFYLGGDCIQQANDATHLSNPTCCQSIDYAYWKGHRFRCSVGEKKGVGTPACITSSRPKPVFIVNELLLFLIFISLPSPDLLLPWNELPFPLSFLLSEHVPAMRTDILAGGHILTAYSADSLRATFFVA